MNTINEEVIGKVYIDVLVPPHISRFKFFECQESLFNLICIGAVELYINFDFCIKCLLFQRSFWLWINYYFNHKKSKIHSIIFYCKSYRKHILRSVFYKNKIAKAYLYLYIENKIKIISTFIM